jgi:hypothetical protein
MITHLFLSEKIDWAWRYSDPFVTDGGQGNLQLSTPSSNLEAINSPFTEQNVDTKTPQQESSSPLSSMDDASTEKR